MAILRGFLFCATIFAFAQSHVRLREPPNRSSLWRDPRFSPLNPTRILKKSLIFQWN
jgi:hypothetical protein